MPKLFEAVIIITSFMYPAFFHVVFPFFWMPVSMSGFHHWNHWRIAGYAICEVAWGRGILPGGDPTSVCPRQHHGRGGRRTAVQGPATCCCKIPYVLGPEPLPPLYLFADFEAEVVGPPLPVEAPPGIVFLNLAQAKKPGGLPSFIYVGVHLHTAYARVGGGGTYSSVQCFDLPFLTAKRRGHAFILLFI